MATHTSTAVANRDVRSVHAGLYAVSVKFNAGGATLSAADVIQMIPVPNDTIVVETQLSGVANNDTTVFDVGTGEDADAFNNDVTLSSTAAFWRSNLPAGNGFQVSLTDTAEPHFDTIDLTVVSTGSATTSCSIVLTALLYRHPK